MKKIKLKEFLLRTERLSNWSLFENRAFGSDLDMPLRRDIIFAVPDLHGRADIAIQIIEILSVLNAKRIVFLGDYIDRGSNSKGVVDAIKNAQVQNPNWIALMGNHELMFIENISSGIVDPTSKGLYSQLEKSEITAYVNHITNLPAFYETKHLIFTHGGIESSYRETNFNNIPVTELLWSYGVNPQYAFKKIIRGHTAIDIPTELNNNNVCLETQGWIVGKPFHIGIISDSVADQNLIGWLELK